MLPLVRNAKVMSGYAFGMGERLSKNPHSCTKMEKHNAMPIISTELTQQQIKVEYRACVEPYNNFKQPS